MIKKVNVVAVVGAVLVFVGFFLSWFAVGAGEEREVIRGFSVARLTADLGPAYYLVYLLPALALGAAVLTFKKPRVGAVLAILTGGPALVWGLYEVARFLYEVTFVGLWMSVGGCILLLLGGILGFSYRPEPEAGSEGTTKGAPSPVPEAEEPDDAA